MTFGNTKIDALCSVVTSALAPLAITPTSTVAINPTRL
jgi:hypothetical protein